VPLWCVTRAAVDPDGDRPGTAAHLWALGETRRSAKTPWYGLVDLPERPTRRELDWLVAVLADSTGPDHVALRPGGIRVRRLARDTASPWAREPALTGTVVITDTGTPLTGAVARWTAARGADHVLVLSRPGRTFTPAEDPAAVTDGCPMTVVPCDPADRSRLAAVLAAVPSGHPLGAVLHLGLAGDPRDSAEQDIRAAADAARNLDDLTRDSPPAHFVLFAPFASPLDGGSPIEHALLHAVHDTLVLRRRAAGAAGASVAWGLADGAGSEVTTGLDRVLGGGESSLVIADIPLTQVLTEYAGRSAHPLLRDLFDAAPEDGDLDAAGGHSRLTAHLAELPAEERQGALLSLVRRSTAFALGHSTIDGVAEDVAFVDLGLTSFTAFELRSRLVEVTGIDLPLSEIFEHPSPSALAGYLHTAYEGAATD
jgi:hypothetical protein